MTALSWVILVVTLDYTERLGEVEPRGTPAYVLFLFESHGGEEAFLDVVTPWAFLRQRP